MKEEPGKDNQIPCLTSICTGLAEESRVTVPVGHGTQCHGGVKEVQGGARGGGLVCVLVRAKNRETYTIVMLEQETARGHWNSPSSM